MQHFRLRRHLFEAKNHTMEYLQPAPFPGAIFNAEGTSLDPTIPDLTEETLVEYPHRSMVARDGAAPIVRVWLLADDATPDAIPPVLMIEAVRLVLAGKGIVILARRLEPAVDVRDGLLDALDRFTADGSGKSEPPELRL